LSTCAETSSRVSNPFATLDAFATSKASTGSHRIVAIGLATDG
jgi:hypothetical protein